MMSCTNAAIQCRIENEILVQPDVIHRKRFDSSTDGCARRSRNTNYIR